MSTVTVTVTGDNVEMVHDLALTARRYLESKNQNAEVDMVGSASASSTGRYMTETTFCIKEPSA